METTINERIGMIIDYSGLTLTAFSRKIGIAQTSLRDCVINNSEPKHSTLYKIIKAEPLISPEWLLLGKGEMIISNEADQKKEGVPHIESVDAWCGQGQGFEVSVMRKDCPSYNIPGAEDADFTIRAKGRSMINRTHPNRSIKEGDYIACKKPHTNVIRYGEIYALATSDGVMVKVVKPCNKDGFIKLESFNTEEGYEPFDYPTIDIHDMALVVAIASINRLA